MSRIVRLRSRAALTVVALLMTSTLSSCSLFGSDDTEGPGVDDPTSAGATEDPLVNSQFTRDGTFQSHIAVEAAPGIDLVLTMYPTKSTPRTNEWYPLGKKYFSFTFQAYDLSQKIRDPFASKRKVYLERMKVTSATSTVDGGKTQRPYKLDVTAAKATFDPEPVQTSLGMLITSPKGAFELRNQPIKKMSLDTRGVTLTFVAIVHIQAKVGGADYVKKKVTQVVPIQIFESEEPTSVASIPVNAN